MNRLPPNRTSALAMEAVVLARRVPTKCDDTTPGMDRMDSPRPALTMLSVPVRALCTINVLWDHLCGHVGLLHASPTQVAVPHENKSNQYIPLLPYCDDVDTLLSRNLVL